MSSFIATFERRKKRAKEEKFGISSTEGRFTHKRLRNCSDFAAELSNHQLLGKLSTERLSHFNGEISINQCSLRIPARCAREDCAHNDVARGQCEFINL